jgi:hypothetical protein
MKWVFAGRLTRPGSSSPAWASASRACRRSCAARWSCSLDFLRPELAGKYKFRLSDIKPIRDLRAGETFVPANIYHAGLLWQNR